MNDTSSARLEIARTLMEEFAIRTGLRGVGGDPARRYLWTDAFAVQTYYGLADALGSKTAGEDALRLIEATHETLGQHHPGDGRTGWISGLPNEQARERPTVAGLRIGKERPERSPEEEYDDRLEWDRDGQYFHYLTRWVAALLHAGEAEGEPRFARWASEMIEAGARFIEERRGQLRMYWKMSVDLQRPLVPTQGAHDPLEGLLCALGARESTGISNEKLDTMVDRLALLCEGRDWSTVDPLGIGGLLLNVSRAAGLSAAGIELPDDVRPGKLLEDSLESLKRYARMHAPTGLAVRRLAFRECGLSLGLHTAYGQARDATDETRVGIRDALDDYLPLAREIETFWSDMGNQATPDWTDHLDINAVSLAASLVAAESPHSYG